jgi:transcription elongation factor Elf1
MWQNIGDHPVIASADPEDVRFKFKCRKCGHTIITDVITIPNPNHLGKNAEESMVYAEDVAVCDQCGEEHEIKISNDRGGVYATIDGVDEIDIFIESV